MRPDAPLTRQAAMRLAACAFAASWQPDGLAAAPAPATLRSRVTDRVFLDVRVIQRYDVAVLEDAAVRGRMAFGLFGEEAPLGTRKWLEFATGRVGQFAQAGGGPSYGSSYFETLRPAVALEGGRINGLKQTQFAGQLEWEYGDKLVPLRAVPEANDLRHDRRGLLTRPLFESGPGFAVTLGPAPELDGRWEVIGALEEGDDMLKLIEGLPYITGRSLEEPGSAPDVIFDMQKNFFGGLSKGIGDTRAEDRTGKLLRRVEIVRAGVL